MTVYEIISIVIFSLCLFFLAKQYFEKRTKKKKTSRSKRSESCVCYQVDEPSPDFQSTWVEPVKVYCKDCKSFGDHGDSRFQYERYTCSHLNNRVDTPMEKLGRVKEWAQEKNRDNDCKDFELKDKETDDEL